MAGFFHSSESGAPAPLLAFRLEWLGISVLALADAILAPLSGLHFHFSLHLGNLVVAPLLIGAVIAGRFHARRAAATLEFFALILTATTMFAVATYIAIAQSGPLLDNRFLLADRMLGFDWLHWFGFVKAHPIADRSLSFLYYSLTYQILYFSVLMGMMGAIGRMRETYWVLFLALALTTMISWLMPAMGPFEVFNLKSYGPFLPEIARLRSGQGLDFSLENLQGIITFPSFHTVLALTMAYAFRETGLIGWILAFANGVLLLGVPVFGGHYLVDMIAGALVFAVSLAAVKIWMPVKSRKGEQESAMAAA